MTLTPVSITTQVPGHCIVQRTFKGRRSSVNENPSCRFRSLGPGFSKGSPLCRSYLPAPPSGQRVEVGESGAQAAVRGGYLCGLHVTRFQHQASLSPPLPRTSGPRSHRRPTGSQEPPWQLTLGRDSGIGPAGANTTWKHRLRLHRTVCTGKGGPGDAPGNASTVSQ